MTSFQRRVVVTVAALVLLSGAAAVVAAAGRRHDRKVRAAATSTTSTSTTTTTTIGTTTTTFDLVPSTTPTTAARPTSTTASTTTTMPLPVVAATGAALQPPSVPTSRTMTGSDCTTLAAGKAQGVSCGTAHASGSVTLVWLIEGSSPGAHARHVYVFVPGPTSTTWKAVLEAVDADGSKWQTVTALVAPLRGDGTDEIAVGFRAASGGSLGLDVVEGPGVVTGHRDLPAGVARVSTGQWDTWATSTAATGQDDHDVIRWENGAWRVVLRSQVAASDVPPSQF